MVSKCPKCGEEHDEAVDCLEHLGVDPDHDLIDHEMKERDARISRLEDRGAVWNEEGRYWALNENDKDVCFDEDGNPM